eukprot:jgi/Botrbrau1/17999/Bobra.0440s0002.1
MRHNPLHLFIFTYVFDSYGMPASPFLEETLGGGMEQGALALTQEQVKEVLQRRSTYLQATTDIIDEFSSSSCEVPFHQFHFEFSSSSCEVPFHQFHFDINVLSYMSCHVL